MEDIIKKLADFKSPSAAEHCQETLQLVMDNAVETVRNKILDLLETVADKVSLEVICRSYTHTPSPTPLSIKPHFQYTL